MNTAKEDSFYGQRSFLPTASMGNRAPGDCAILCMRAGVWEVGAEIEKG